MLTAFLSPEWSKRLLHHMEEFEDDFATSPVTTMSRLKKMVIEAAGATGPKDFQSALISELPQIWIDWVNADLTRDRENRTHLVDRPAGQSLVFFLLENLAASTTTGTYVRDLVSSRVVLYDNTAGVEAIADASALVDREDVLFEIWAKSLSRALAQIAETNYKYHLQICSDVTDAVLRREVVQAGTLGRTMHRCQLAWRDHYPDLVPLVLKNAKIVRNSESHGHTVIDPGNETVTFFDPGRGGEKQIGPLTRTDFRDFAEKLVWDMTALCAALELVHRRIWMFQVLSFGAQGEQRPGSVRNTDKGSLVNDIGETA